jgi:hypothetical protein
MGCIAVLCHRISGTCRLLAWDASFWVAGPGLWPASGCEAFRVLPLWQLFLFAGESVSFGVTSCRRCSLSAPRSSGP